MEKGRVREWGRGRVGKGKGKRKVKRSGRERKKG